MRILFVLENHYPNIGGVETLFKSLTESLVKEGHEITILTNKFAKHLERRVVLNGVTIIRVPFFNRYLFTLLGVFPAIRLALKNDIIHTTSYNAGVPAFFAGLLTGRKVIITFHEVWGKLWFRLPFMSKFSLSLHYLFEKALLRLPFHKYVAVSEATKASLQKGGIKSERISLIYNGIDYSELERITASQNSVELVSDNSEKYRFIYFGRLGISKGLDILLDGIQLLKESGGQFNFQLVIPSEPQGFHNTILDLIKEKEISDCVQVASDLEWNTLVKNISNSDAVVIPSYSEGFCFTAVESMGIGTPIISSSKGALAEVVSGQHLTMDTHDGQGLFTAMQGAMDGEWQNTSLRRFPLDDSIEQYLKLYSNVSSTNAKSLQQ